MSRGSVPGPFRRIKRRKVMELLTLECGHVIMANIYSVASFGCFCPHCREEDEVRARAAQGLPP